MKEKPDCGVSCEGAALNDDPGNVNAGAGLGVVVGVAGCCAFEAGTCEEGPASGAAKAGGKNGLGLAGVVD